MNDLSFEPGERIPPSITLVGAGAVGSLVAATLAGNRVPFHWLVRNPQRRLQLDAIRVHVDDSSSGGSFEQSSVSIALDRVKLHASADDLPWAQWLIVCVKAQQVEEVLAELAPTPSTEVLVIANGLHRGPFHLGILFGGAYLNGGWLHTGLHNDLVLGELGLGWEADESIDLLMPLSSPFLHPIPDSHLEERMWMKAALNCVVNPLSAIQDVPNGELLRQLDRPQVKDLLAELKAVLSACAPLREPLRMADLRAELRELLQATSSNSSSMREDIRAGRETEISRLNLAMAAAGEAAGVPCPRLRELGEEVLKLEQRARVG